jgi:hypothetical protein
MAAGTQEGNMQVRDIVKDYLIANAAQYDGLVSDDRECGCLTQDLAPCGEMYDTCAAGYRAKCGCGEAHDFHIIAGKKMQRGHRRK